MYKCLLNKVLSHLSQKFTRRSEVHDRAKSRSMYPRMYTDDGPTLIPTYLVERKFVTDSQKMLNVLRILNFLAENFLIVCHLS